MKARAIGSRLIVELLETEKIINGIHVPDSVTIKQRKCKVVAAGPLAHIKVNSIVTLLDYPNEEYVEDNKTYYFAKSENVLVIH